MAKRGPKPTPTHILQMRDSWRANARREPQALDRTPPKRPHWLKGDAQRLWDKLAPLLYASGRLIQEQAEPFATAVCVPYGIFREAERQLQELKTEKGRLALLLKTKSGNPAENPLLWTHARAWDQFVKGCALFGLTPADIAGVQRAEPPAEDDRKAQFFQEGA